MIIDHVGMEQPRKGNRIENVTNNDEERRSGTKIRGLTERHKRRKIDSHPHHLNFFMHIVSCQDDELKADRCCNWYCSII